MPLLFLEEYLDTIVALPSEVQRSLSQIKEQDALCNVNSNKVTQGITKILDENTKLTAEQANSLLDEIRDGLLQGLSHAEEKVSLAESIHETVRGHIVKLEDDLKHFEEEVRLAKLQSAHHTIVHDIFEAEKDILDEEEEEDTNKAKKRGKSKEETAGEGIGGRKRSKTSLVNTESPAQIRKDHPPGNGDPGSEPTYCYCKQHAYGEMIGCDANTECEIEWFHYGCVGLETPPKDQWFCPECSARLARDPLSVTKEKGSTKKPRPTFVK